MQYSYSRPTIKCNTWLISCSDINIIYQFVKRKFQNKNPSFHLETNSGNNRKYDSFKEFEKDLSDIKKLKEEITKILIQGSSFDVNYHSYIIVSIDFVGYQPEARFSLASEGKNNKKDWVDGAYEEMNRIAKSFILSDNMKCLLEKEYGLKHHDHFVIQDFWGEKRKRLETILEKQHDVPSNISGNIIINSQIQQKTSASN